MATRSVKLPDIGEGVTQAELVEWHVKVGDLVREDEPLAAVMTDKATVEIPSLYSGTVTWIGGDVGDVMAIGSDLVRIAVDGDPTIDAADPADGLKRVIAASDAPNTGKPAAEEVAIVPPRTLLSKNAGAPRAEGAEPLASPAVRVRARENGIDLRQVCGSGPAGRITQADLDAVFAGPRATQTALAGRQPRTGSHQVKVVGLRRKIAERMMLSYSRIPHITLIEEIDVTALEQLKEKLNAERGDRTKLTMLPFVMAALARVFARHPEMNAHFDDEAGVVTHFDGIHFGIATMTDNGLVVPVVRHAESLDLFETASEIDRLSRAARAGTVDRGELGGSTFTITSLGPLGAIATTPIINHPEVAILGVNKMAVRPIWDGAQFQPRKMMNLSASFDHRVIDGWDAAVFVSRLKALIETPAMIFVAP